MDMTETEWPVDQPPKTKGRKPKAAKAAEAFEPIEKQLWKTADKLRKNIDAAEYKHIVLGLGRKYRPTHIPVRTPCEMRDQLQPLRS